MEVQPGKGTRGKKRDQPTGGIEKIKGVEDEVHEENGN